MDDDTNALNKLPKTVRFQLMITLAYMWCTIFSLGIGSYAVFGTSIILHSLVLVGIFFTADMFQRAREGGIVSLFNHKKSANTVHDLYEAQGNKN